MRYRRFLLLACLGFTVQFVAVSAVHAQQANRPEGNYYHIFSGGISRLGMATEAHEAGTHMIVGGSGTFNYVGYLLGQPTGGWLSWYINAQLDLTVDWHEQEAQSGGEGKHEADEAPHSDLLVVPEGSMHTLIPIPPLAIGRAFAWGVILGGVGVYGEGSFPWLDLLDTRLKTHDLLYLHGKLSSGVTLVVTARAAPPQPGCASLADELARLGGRAKVKGAEKTAEASGCAALAQTLDGLARDVRETKVGSVFDPDRWRLRLHAGPAYAIWRMQHPHATPFTEEGSSMGGKTEVGDGVIKKPGLLMLLAELMLTTGQVQPFVGSKLFFCNWMREISATIGARIPWIGGWTLVINALEYRELAVQGRQAHIVPTRKPFYKTSGNLEWRF